MRNLMIAGIVMILAGTFLIVGSSFLYSSQGNVSWGGFVLIGPIPIVFGNGKYGSVVSILSLVLGILMIVLLYIYLKKGRSSESLK